MNFGNLYNYATTRGIVIPETSSIKSKVTECFKEIFGNDFDTTDETPGGRFIEAITLLFVDILGVNAQNTYLLNPNFAIGQQLDNIGSMFGISRLAGESDSSFRARMLRGQSRGIGFESSIIKAVSAVPGVTSVCVLNNGSPDPKVIPNNLSGIAVDAHSVYVCVGGGSNANIAKAIANSISAGCAYHDTGASTEYGQKQEESWTDQDTRTPMFVRFYRPIATEIEIVSECVNINHDASTLENDVKEIVAGYINGNSEMGFVSHNTNCVVTPTEIISAVASRNIGAYLQKCSFRTTVNGVLVETDKFTFFPYTAASLSDGRNIVSVI